MKLTEITKDEFVGKLKDPFMGRVVAGVNRVMSKLSKDWQLITAPTYEDSINDVGQKTYPDDPDVIVFKVRSAWERGTNRNQIKSDVWDVRVAIEDIFVPASTDDEQDWGKNGEEIRTITVYIFEEDKIKT